MTIKTFETKGLTLTGSVQQLDSLGGAKEGVTIRAGDSDVYFGYRDDITAGTVDATDGMRIPFGEKDFVELDNSGVIYVIGTTGDKITYRIE